MKERAAPALVIFISTFLFAFASQASAGIYWANNYSIGRVNLDGTNPDFDFISEFSNRKIFGACGVAVNGSYVFWGDVEQNAIGRANLDGTEPNYTFITGANEPCGVAVDGLHVYWANRGGGGIGRANLDGSEVMQSFVNEAYGTCGVAVDGSHIFWASFLTDSIGRADLDGKNASQYFIEGADGACGVAVNESHIYWGTYGAAIGRANLDGTNSTAAFITGLGRPCGIAVDDAHVYWTEEAVSTGRLIGRANLDGTAVKRDILTGLFYPCGIAVDALTFGPPSPPPLPPLSEFTFGKVKHSKRKWITFIAVDVPEGGFFRVGASSGVRWTILPEHTTGHNLATGGRKWIKLWPAGKGLNGRRLRRTIQRRGKARIVVEVYYMAAGKRASTKLKWLSIVRDGA